ncbi:50S ribosomal protein L5 [Candidatus Desantisbacteria bacterium CG_4_10_14_0_8_um_filter_48_22]|uniref:Large ribosomal subunit protein uL5 n=1 Tax=Candidatus Desantisbacteria bacterium CG_4_10_14_0_8_um_filter_48_22 TaxID=1974543 RepID=A0A2M7S9K6_9BACT|nr:ribosomal protein L5 [uncultured bacterium]OIO03460.1 MAG: 50S ribosomal protein L5 [Candidatus Desantisbacteria bacterium CG1_02_49_89]PIV54670.1 MAG: 50S ribosomal protein L5 [Candidatus Desantisbacteria bacterium CG02_land_8_20_14_3_00_49_13]PIZ16170.1 MAG: 50S ribosomal protein L5 [Candidatus Desantisbacteria bacterium CG_4_10_14_0_8_um_filter_48_22]PJB27609.1 MAG: 50S ribosomal protein L5 [Candidatus Desantisbacteria bacterium CG_4_9_14_3_um_filter_50_7]
MKQEEHSPEKTRVKPRLLEYYQKEVIPALIKKFNYSNPLEVPRLTKIVINIGVGEGGDDQKAIDAAVNDLAMITGQKPVITRAKKSISNFKLRKGATIGCKVTLRRDYMYEFFDRLVNTVLPRIRDFSGIPSKISDGHGNFTIGLKEQIIFPEIDYDKIYKMRGMDITIVTTTDKDEEGKEMLVLMGMPFSKKI